MNEQLNQLKKQVVDALQQVARDFGVDDVEINDTSLQTETPPSPELGDAAFPMFPFAKIFRKAPQQIAAAVSEKLRSSDFSAAGPYVNAKFDITQAASIINTVLEQGSDFGKADKSLQPAKKVMIEFSCPNTNKPLHFGHLRNNILGESVSRILKAVGMDVEKVNLINDRGIHICKSMLAYQKFGNGATPESAGIKGDHFVGDYYVRYHEWAKEDETADQQVRDMLVKWEDGDKEIISLWKRMNGWAISGLMKTYEHTGIAFDRFYYESNTYKKGRDEILKGLEKGIFYKEDDGSVWIDLSDIKLDKKVLLRKDGTSLYLTQDIGTAIARHADFPFEQLIYVVGSEQNYHFNVLFHVLKKLGFDWANQLYHLSYGMIYLPEGKMKSREGTKVDADDMVEKLTELAIQEIRDKERVAEIEDLETTGKSIALGALHYFLLQFSPTKDITFDPRESISFAGNTGPYLQYMCARISSMLRKYEIESRGGSFKPELLVTEEERELIKLVLKFPETVVAAANNLNPAALTSFAYDLAKAFARFYHEHQVVQADTADLAETRIKLSQAILQVLKNVMQLLAVPFLEKM